MLKPTTQEIADLERIACELAVQAGRLIVDERPRALGVTATKSSDTDVVTIMDQRSEELLRERLAVQRPQDGVLGEEGEHRTGSSGITWVLDPIDGTVNYLYEIPQYAVSVAACTGDPLRPGEWATLAGAVYAPVTGELFHARIGGGAHLRHRGATTPLRVSAQRRLEHALVGTGFGYAADVRARQGAIVADLLPQVRDIRRAGSAALDLAGVAAGRLDAYYEAGLQPWDLAAGALVVTEAGGVLKVIPDTALTLAGPAELVAALQPIVDHATR